MHSIKHIHQILRYPLECVFLPRVSTPTSTSLEKKKKDKQSFREKIVKSWPRYWWRASYLPVLFRMNSRDCSSLEFLVQNHHQALDGMTWNGTRYACCLKNVKEKKKKSLSLFFVS